MNNCIGLRQKNTEQEKERNKDRDGPMEPKRGVGRLLEVAGGVKKCGRK